MVKVIKRDGRVKSFQSEYIFNAIEKANIDAKSDIDVNKITNKVKQKIFSNYLNEITVEEIQDIVLDELKLENEKVYNSYKKYREERSLARKQKTYNDFMSIVGTVNNDITRDNANMNADTPAGMMMKFASETTKPFTDDKLLSEDVKNAIRDNYLHVHDKDYYPTKSFTCLQHPLDRILENGFRAGHGSSRPAKRIETASIIGCISLESIQNEMHGGQAIPAWDFYMAPYVRKTFIEEVKNIEDLIGEDLNELYNIEIDDYISKPLDGLTGKDRYLQKAINKTVNRVKQSMESFIHNMNTIHSRGGNQVVFSSVNYGTDTSAEGRCVIREMLLSTYDGIGNGETPIFPIQIWKKKRGVNYLPEDRNYDLYKLACKVTAKRFFPNFINLDATFNKSDNWKADDPKRYLWETATMGCRTRVFEDINGDSTSVGRGNLSFTTINIVRLALEAREKYCKKEERINDFFNRLNKYMDLTAKQLDERFQFQKTALKKQFPLLMSGMWNGSEYINKEDTVDSVINKGTLGIGFIGLAETLIALIGKHHGESDEAQELGIKILTFMNEKVEEYKIKYNHNYSILGTPAESVSGRFTKADRDRFGNIENVTNRDYYTNSSHVPVWYKTTIQHKAEIEAPYHNLERGGHIFYCELDGDATHNPSAIERVVDYMDEYNMGYGSINHVRNRCIDCGFENAEDGLKVCPRCGSENIDTIARITGYLVGSTNSWNRYKLAELHDRVKHN